MSTRDPRKSLPYYRWWVDAWRADRRVQRLNITAKGIARELLDECWITGYVPNDLMRLAEISSCRLSVLEREWKQIGVLFREVENTDGHFLTSDFVELERNEQDTKRAKAAIAGRLGALKKLANASDRQRTPYSSSRVEESSSTNERSLALDDARSLVIDMNAKCEECPSRGPAFAAGVHEPGCSLAPKALRKVSRVGAE